MTTLAMRRLGSRLRNLREQAGMSTYDVAQTKILSRRTLGRLEKGENAPAWPIVVALAEHYGASPAYKAQLRDMAIAAPEGGYAEKYAGNTPKGFSLLPELEEDSQSICSYNPEVWPGYLQPPAYARALIETGTSDDDISGAVTVRSERGRRILDRPKERPVMALLTEGAFMRQVGGRECWEESKRELAKMSTSPCVEVRILPNEVGEYPASSGPFTILTFENKLDPDIVYTETLVESNYQERPDIVRAYVAAFEATWGQAVDVKEYYL